MKFQIVTNLYFPKACPYHHECSDWDWGGWRELSLTVLNNLYEWFSQCPDVFSIKTPDSCFFPPPFDKWTCICSLCKLWEVISCCTTHICFEEMLLVNYSMPVCVLYTECVDTVVLSSLADSWLYVCVRGGGAFKCSQFEEGALLFLPSLPLHRTFPGDGSDGEWDGVTPLIHPSLSSPWWPFRFKTLQRGRYCGSFLHLCHRSVSDCKDCIFIFFILTWL